MISVKNMFFPYKKFFHISNGCATSRYCSKMKQLHNFFLYLTHLLWKKIHFMKTKNFFEKFSASHQFLEQTLYTYCDQQNYEKLKNYQNIFFSNWQSKRIPIKCLTTQSVTLWKNIFKLYNKLLMVEVSYMGFLYIVRIVGHSHILKFSKKFSKCH